MPLGHPPSIPGRGDNDIAPGLLRALNHRTLSFKPEDPPRAAPLGTFAPLPPPFHHRLAGVDHAKRLTWARATLQSP